MRERELELEHFILQGLLFKFSQKPCKIKFSRERERERERERLRETGDRRRKESETDRQTEREKQINRHLNYLKLATDFSSGPFTTTPMAPWPLTANT